MKWKVFILSFNMVRVKKDDVTSAGEQETEMLSHNVAKCNGRVCLGRSNYSFNKTSKEKKGKPILLLMKWIAMLTEAAFT